MKTLTITNHANEPFTYGEVTKFAVDNEWIQILLANGTDVLIDRSTVQNLVVTPGAETGLSFDMALIAMKEGHRVARAGWNGRGMWICLGQGGVQTAENFWNKHTRAFAESIPERRAEVLPYFIMKTADDKILMGWLASQSDLVATDWEILP